MRSVQRGFEAGQSVRLPHWHVPAAHVVPGPQETPQAPQFRASAAYDAGSTQVPLQRSCPDGQVRSGDFGEHAASARTAIVGASEARVMRR